MANNNASLGRVRLILWLLVAALAIGALVLFMTRAPQSPYGPPAGGSGEATKVSLGGPFTLQTPDGGTFSETDLVGKPHALFFGFTRCPDVCPTSLQRMAKLRNEMNKADPGSGDKFDIVFISIDPESDTPEIVGNYVDLFGTPIIGLTGTSEQVAQAAKAYGAYYAKRPLEGGGYTMDHSAAILLLDAEGEFSGTIDTQESDEVARQKLENLVG